MKLLTVYYGGDIYDLDDTEEFIPNNLDGMEYMTCTQCHPDGGDNRSVNAVNMTPMCRTVHKGARGKHMNPVTRRERIRGNWLIRTLS